MTFAVLRALHTIIGEALDDIQRIYEPRSGTEDNSELFCSDGVSPPSPPPSPCAPVDPQKPLDFPSLDTWFDPADPAEQLRTHPDVVVAINRIVAAAGQMSITVQPPFFALLDASFAYHLPSCLRIVEASHTIEILREAGPDGVHVDALAKQNGIEKMRLSHILRVLATHHILREREPDVFALNRVSSVCDSGKAMSDIRLWEKKGRPEMKYRGTNGVAALVGLNTDELMKASAYMTEAYLLSRDPDAPPPFNFAFNTETPYFHWLEGVDTDASESAGQSKPSSTAPSPTPAQAPPKPAVLASPVPMKERLKRGLKMKRSVEVGPGDVAPLSLGLEDSKTAQASNPNKYRLERFGVAMSGTGSWEVPGAIFNGFDWLSLTKGSVIVDVGGGIGSSSMMLAEVFCRPSKSEAVFKEEDPTDREFKFIIQDRPVVVEMGEKAWKEKCPELLVPDIAQFQVHDFFTPQPIKNAAVFFLRVITHDWPDDQVRQIFRHLREAALPETKLVLADFVLPLACVDDIGGSNTEYGLWTLEGVQGAERALAEPPLLANLGKASASAYWMDLTMNTVFNSRERTLREMVALTSATGWKIVKFTRAPGSLFAHMVAVPVEVPLQVGPIEFVKPDDFDAASTIGAASRSSMMLQRSVSRCGTPTFGSRMELPSPRDKTKSTRSKINGLLGKVWGTSSKASLKLPTTPGKPAKKKPSPLSALGEVTSTPKPLPSPRSLLPSSPIWRRKSQAQLQKLSTPRPSVDHPPLPALSSPFSQSTANLPVPSTPQAIPKTPSFMSMRQRLRSTSISSLSPTSMRSRRRPGGSSFSQFPFPENTEGANGSGPGNLSGARLDFAGENVADLYNPPATHQRGLSVSMLAEAAQIETRMHPVPSSP